MLFYLIVSAGCSDDYDDSKLWDSVNGLENRVAKLEELCKQMNTNISSLQEIVTALQKNESIKSVATLTDGNGYLITFSSGKTITIYHGKNGINGTDGEDGKDGQNGKDGTTPTISVKKDIDGIYYWTVDNDWLLVDGKKVKAEGIDGIDGGPGKDGEDGTNGKDGVTPQFKITDGYWYISYDNEQSWTKLGKATGDSGLNRADGDNFFKGVSIEDGYVCFTLNDKDATIIKLPFVSESELTIEVKEPGTLKSLLTDEDMRTVISLKLVGSLNDDDFATIRYWMFVVENVDLSETDINEVPKDGFREMPRLRKVVLPESCTKIGDYSFYKCRILSIINTTAIQYVGNESFNGCENLNINEFPNAKMIGEGTFGGCRKIKKLSMPNAVVSSSAVYQCPNLTDLIIGNFVNGKFDGEACSSELKITLNGIDDIADLKVINAKEIIIGQNIYDFSGSLESVQVEGFSFEEPSRFPDFRDNLFSDSKIQNFVLPSSVVNLGQRVFENSRYLETVIIPKYSRLKKIEGEYNSSTFHYSKTGIFSGCTSLKDIYCYLSTPPIVKYTLFYISDQYADSTSQTVTLHVPSESIELYRQAIGWGAINNIVAIE